MKTAEILSGQSFWTGGYFYTATTDAQPDGDNWVILMTIDEDGNHDPLSLHVGGHVLPA